MRKDVERLIPPARRDLVTARKNIGRGASEVAAFLSHPASSALPWKRGCRPGHTLAGKVGDDDG
jgi:hypothetical protein